MVESIVPPANYSHRETEILLKKWNGRIAQASPQLIEYLTDVEAEEPADIFPKLDRGGNWISTYKLNDTYTLGSLYKDSTVLPTPIFVEFANEIRLVPAVYIKNDLTHYYFVSRKVDVTDEKGIDSGFTYLFGGQRLEDIPVELLAQHTPAANSPFYVEKFAIADFDWEWIVVLPLFYKGRFYLMILPSYDSAKEDRAEYTSEEARVKWKRMIEEEYEQRLLFKFDKN